MEVISTYSRKQAIEDGVLHDVTETAREAGIIHPVAVTAAVWNTYVTVPPAAVGQDEAGRLWDILWMFRIAASVSDRLSEIVYPLYVANDASGPKLVELKAVSGPGDTLAPVLTIMMPGED